MEDYVTVNGRKYRKGYTTGSCAAAASKAAALMLVSGRRVSEVEIDAPAGIKLKFPVEDAVLKGDTAVCSVVKDGGDDPDVTSGLKIFAEAKFADRPGVRVSAGEGIGRVTLPGLKVPVGHPAINPVPMEMILKEVGEVLEQGTGVEITISVPGGEEAAAKTYNPRLGIVGGISILGTTGIVEPMSEESWKDSLALQLDVAAANGFKEAVFVFGNYGEDYAVKKLGLDEEKIIKVSNFMGFMIDRALEKGFQKILIVGHLGKLVKVAAGIFHTHSRVADARTEILAAYSALEGASSEVVEKIFACRTTDAAVRLIKEFGMCGVFERIVSNVSQRCRDYSHGRMEFGTVLFDGAGGMLAADGNAERFLNILRKGA
ncbi:MAG: cobalt-precorrin-5B (C(1))-methyltransferase CbiD [Firmicutes bacterium]|nr:cobalt-precorrin-5B (C(1))-methyltransferase CbiD [Bacillota bacterium]